MNPLTAVAALLLIGASPADAGLPPAAEPIAALDQGLLDAMHAGKSQSFTQRYEALKPLVQKAFDLDTILSTSVGPRWPTFTPEQQQDLQKEFLRFTVASYVSNFSSFSGERFAIDPRTRDVGGEQVVSTHIVSNGADAARIDYVMKQSDGAWRAVDVLLDGSISRVAVQRSDFRSQLEGGPDSLLATLKKKVSDLSGGANVP